MGPMPTMPMFIAYRVHAKHCRLPEMGRCHSPRYVVAINMEKTHQHCPLHVMIWWENAEVRIERLSIARSSIRDGRCDFVYNLAFGNQFFCLYRSPYDEMKIIITRRRRIVDVSGSSLFLNLWDVTCIECIQLFWILAVHQLEIALCTP